MKTVPFLRLWMGNLAVCYCVALSAPALAQDNSPEVERDVINTDRPDFTESALVVRRGVLQLESGFTYQRADGMYAFLAPEALFRYGVGKKFEWRLQLPNYVRLRDSGQTTRGLGATYFGFKYQIGPTADGTDISIIPAVFIPTGGSAFNSGAWDPEVKLCVSRDLTERLGVAGMLYGAWTTDSGQRNFALQQTISFAYDLGGRWASFLEFANTFAENSTAQNLIHTGLTYLLNNDTQFDIHFGFGLSKAAPDHFIGAGYSVRF